jgi:disulfide bond formation protein DsbB
MSPETLQIYNTLLAVLSLVAIIGAVGLTGYRMVRGREAAAVLDPGALWLAWLVAVVATAGSLIYSEVVHFVPCRLCWFQRIAMYPLSIVLLVGAIRREAAARFYALPLAIVGLGMSTYHYILQLFPSLEGGACDPANPCSARYVETFGFISIPFMAWAGFLAIAVLLAFYSRGTRE